MTMPGAEDPRHYKTFGQEAVEEQDSSWSRERLQANIQQLVGSCSARCLMVWALCWSCWEHEAAMIRFISSDLLISSCNHAGQIL